MNRDTIIGELASDLDLDEINEDIRFKEDLNMEEVELVDMVMEIEAEHDILLDDEVASNIKTVGDLIKAVEDLDVWLLIRVA